MVSRSDYEGAGRSEWLVRFSDCAAGTAFPGTSSSEKDVRCYLDIRGAAGKSEETFKPIRAFKKAALDFVGPLPQPALQSMFDALYPPGLQWYWRADFVKK